MALALTTKLEAVNIVLDCMGENPINTLEAGSGKPRQAVLAERQLDNTSREVQTRGWHFNTEKKYDLVRDGSNKITLASNVLKVDTEVNKYTDIDVVQRGTTLYDKKNHTDTFTQDLEVEIVFYLKWTQLPEAFRNWIAIRAGRKMNARYLGDGDGEVFTMRDEMEAKRLAKAAEGKNSDRTIFDNVDYQTTLRRS
tara:strand:+ start:5304 stop:5891 length:588 start_codon:yes stop_codon:yes gene_type:complete